MKRFAPLLVLATTLAHADSGFPTVHEYVPELSSDEGTMLVSSGGSTPDAILYQGEMLPQPEGGAAREDEQPMRAAEGNGEQVEEAGRRSPSFRPDRVTDLDGTIGYYEVFTPTISPFKRVTAYDAVALAADGTPILTIAPSTRVQVDAVGAETEPPDARPRDRFWGSVVLDFSEGDTVPFPAVSPESRILTMSTDPQALLRIERDGADNLYAVSVGGEREVRVVFLTDAPRTYFGTSIPHVPLRAMGSTIAPLPPSVQRDAETFAAELGLSRASYFDEALRELVEHFRSFEESEQPPRDTGNIYLDLARGRRGICRHRAYGFVITALAIGLASRFVQNEAHAWVEVELPNDGGWLRVDLGGAATGLETRGDDERPPYDPNVEDSLPRPEAYERAYEEARRMSGARAAERASEAGEGPGPSADPGGAPDPAGAVAPVEQAPGTPPRAALELSLDRRAFEVFRGRELEVTGSARGPGDTSGLRVEVLLRALRGDREWLLGVTVTREGGRFRGVFGVPPAQQVGDYRLVVRTPGNRRFAPAQAF